MPNTGLNVHMQDSEPVKFTLRLISNFATLMFKVGDNEVTYFAVNQEQRDALTIQLRAVVRELEKLYPKDYFEGLERAILEGAITPEHLRDVTNRLSEQETTCYGDMQSHSCCGSPFTCSCR